MHIYMASVLTCNKQKLNHQVWPVHVLVGTERCVFTKLKSIKRPISLNMYCPSVCQIRSVSIAFLVVDSSSPC